MQELDALKAKSLSELRQIAKALGITEQLKKKELLDRIVEVASGATAETNEATSAEPVDKPKRGRRPRVNTTRIEDAKSNIVPTEAQPVAVAEPISEEVQPEIAEKVEKSEEPVVQPKKRGRKPKNQQVEPVTELPTSDQAPEYPELEYEMARNEHYVAEEEVITKDDFAGDDGRR